MKKINSIAFSLLFSVQLIAQTAENTKYDVLSYFINHYIGQIECDYFYKKPIVPQNPYSDTTSIVSFTDPETYEGITLTKAAYDSTYFRKSVLAYEKELKSWKIHKKLDKKVILISEVPKSYKEHLLYQVIKNAPAFADLQQQLNHANSITWNLSKINNQTDYVLADESTSEYSIVMYLFLSDIIINKDQTKAALYFGIHYKDRKEVRWGYGNLIYLEKGRKNWAIVKQTTLWEE
jgi:hypothetical protein